MCQVISCPRLIAEARIQSQSHQYEFCVGCVALGQFFLLARGFPPVTITPMLYTIHLSPIL